MRKTESITIEEANYILIEMPATIRTIIALELKHILAGAKDGIKDLDSDIDYTLIVSGVLERLEPAKGAKLLSDIIKNGLQFPVVTDQMQYDEYFGEFYDHQIDLVAEIMKMNFGKSIENIKKKLEKTGILSLISSEPQKKKTTQAKKTG